MGDYYCLDIEALNTFVRSLNLIKNNRASTNEISQIIGSHLTLDLISLELRRKVVILLEHALIINFIGL